MGGGAIPARNLEANSENFSPPVVCQPPPFLRLTNRSYKQNNRSTEMGVERKLTAIFRTDSNDWDKLPPLWAPSTQAIGLFI